VDDIARLAQNHDKFPNLDSKNFGKTKFFFSKIQLPKKKSNTISHLKKMFWFSDNGFKKKDKVGRVFISNPAWEGFLYFVFIFSGLKT
jgi:hypothetical protein